MLAGYFPQGKWKEPFFRQCMDEVSRAGEVPILLIGDLNTGRNDLDIEGGGTPFHCADLFEGLESRAGLIDLWRAENGNRQEWTWRSIASGFRIDHAFGNKPLLERFGPIFCRYDHAPRETKITDHRRL
jgi:exonuclease III